jgi:hypothetical protein
MMEGPMTGMNGRRIAFAIMIGSTLAAMPGAATGSVPGERHAGVQLVQYGCQVFGPVATMGRANEIANQARASGFNALAYHNGDGYYVKVC